MTATADALALVGLLAVLGTVAIVARRHVESRRPPEPRNWCESPWGDVPNVPVHVEGDTQ